MAVVKWITIFISAAFASGKAEMVRLMPLAVWLSFVMLQYLVWR